MPRGKQYIASFRTTKEGLAILNGLKERLGLSWDRMLLAAVNAHYNIEVPMPALVGPTPEERAKASAAKDTEKRQKAEARDKAAAERKAEKAKAKAEGRKAKKARKTAERKAGKANAKKS